MAMPAQIERIFHDFCDDCDQYDITCIGKVLGKPSLVTCKHYRLCENTAKMLCNEVSAKEEM